MKIEDLKKYFDENWVKMESQYVDFLSFKSISTDSKYNEDCHACVNWLAEQFKQINFSTDIIKTSTKPLLIAEFRADSSAPKVIFYGHYDVQPVDPVNLWSSDPFKPVIKDGQVFARGAQDNKGQVFYVLKAIEALVKSDALKVNLTVVIEGEEECGSSGIREILPQIKDRLTGDLLMVCDTGMRNLDTPAITMGLRGIIALEVILKGANKDLHSGIHGGICKNPATELAKLVAGITDSNGRITIPGYYDNVREVLPRELEEIEKLNFKPNDYEKEIGIPPNGGEQGMHPMIRNGFRPTIEVNGIYGGYQGEGGKTIIPSNAGVKLSSRLVGGQDPARCAELLRKYFIDNCPQGLMVEFGHAELGGPAVLLNPDAPCIKKAEAVLKEIFPNPADLIWEGASIPIVSSLAKYTNEQALLVGFGLESDNIHAPNENFSIERIRRGFLYVGKLLQDLVTT